MIEDIKSGKMDDKLDMIIAAVKARKDALKPQIWEFAIGDIVRMTKDANPKYLIGQEAKVVKVNRSKIVISFLDKSVAGRFQGNVTCPLSIVEKV